MQKQDFRKLPNSYFLDERRRLSNPINTYLIFEFFLSFYSSGFDLTDSVVSPFYSSGFDLTESVVSPLYSSGVERGYSFIVEMNRFLVLPDNLIINGYKYKLGLNIVPQGSDDGYFRQKKGIALCKKEDLHLYVGYGNKFGVVKLPDDTHKNKFILKKIIDFDDWDDWESIIKADYRCVKFMPIDVFKKLRPDSLQNVSIIDRTEAVCDFYIQLNGKDLEFVPTKYKTIERCIKALQNHAYAIEFIPDEFNLHELAIKKRGDALRFLDDAIKTKELCMIAVRQNGWALQWVPIALRSRELCMIAVKQNSISLDFVPYDLRDNEIYLLADGYKGTAGYFR